MQPRISMITLGVGDMAAACAFYEQGLGLPRMPSPPEVAFFTLNGTWLGLFGRADLAKDAGVPAEGSGFAGVALAHNLADEDQVDALLVQAEAAGAKVLKRGTRAEWGGYHGFFADLDGHVWEVAHNPFFWVGPEEVGA